MNQDIWIVDAFAPVPFTGNAAAVKIMDSFPDDTDMQKTAFQMQLSETAFVVPNGTGYDLRWFTPEAEVNLCGHATLAAAHVLKQAGLIQAGDSVIFHTRSGDLKARALENKSIELDFPTLPGQPAKAPKALEALGVEILACEKNRDNYLVEVKNYEVLVECKPNFKKLSKMDAQGVIVTTARDVPAGFDFASRYFAPSIGIEEDPVTGSAHCFLGVYWAKKLGKNRFHAYQASKGMGVLDVTVSGERTLLSGRAFTTIKGDMGAARRPVASAQEVQEVLNKIKGSVCI